MLDSERSRWPLHSGAVVDQTTAARQTPAVVVWQWSRSRPAHVRPGCRLRAPAGWLHRTLADTNTRLVIGTDLPGAAWTSPINKDPADRPPEPAT